ncbi:MAG: triose-phosphate isomerase [Gammaproteobacteria bacterium]|nr:triose-phosphate isomerase [Gammaproteobacteria bacterium]
MKPKIIAGNWKMQGSLQEITNLIREVCSNFDVLNSPSVQVIVFPSFVYLHTVHQLLQNSPVLLGAQNVNEHVAGAYTGEVAASMLKDMRCQFVILGHSERRHVYKESNELVAEKVQRALEVQLTPILCVGELLEDREKGRTEAVIQAQLQAVIDAVGYQAFQQCIIAYEPVWAIGTGLTATPEQAESVQAFIRKLLKQGGTELANKMSILYGGSVKPDNAASFLSVPGIDGVLIGGASLKAQSFVDICKVGIQS